MYKIKILKNKKKMKEVIPPKFKTKHEEFRWYRKQQMKEQLLNIKYVSIQYKDIRMMLFESDDRLVNLYMRTNFNDVNDEDYINISRFKDGCDIIVSLIINSDWLINEEEFEQKSEDEIQEEINKTQEILNLLKSSNQIEITQNRIILLEYKLQEIQFFLQNKHQKTLTLS